MDPSFGVAYFVYGEEFNGKAAVLCWVLEKFTGREMMNLYLCALCDSI